jgi:hypothetical protein
LVRSAEELLNSQPSLSDLKNQQTVTTTVVKAIQSELASTTKNQALDRATVAEEKDGRLNEK